MSRKIRMGMVGGGRDAFIGAVHRMAAALDGHIELVCGAFSSDPERSRVSGADLYLPANRVYGDFHEMMAAEAKLPAGERMDFVSVVTPNNVHFPVAKAALEAGFHVMSDKPMTFDRRRGQGAGGAGGAHRPAVRPDPQLHRLSDGQRGAPHGT